MSLKVNGVLIRDTFAEAFPMQATRIIVTAHNKKWLNHAVASATGFATSVIACKVEAGVEQHLDPVGTPDGRVGSAILLFSMSGSQLEQQVQDRIGQCILTAPTSAVYSGIDQGTPVAMGKAIRYFGDGFQISKKLGEQRIWRIPVMDGEFVCEDMTHRVDAVGGGNFLIVARDIESALQSAENAVAAIAEVAGSITPFPGGVVRSGSKVGSKYPKLIASTNDAYCPTLRGLVETNLPDDANCTLEIVIDGLSEDAVSQAMRAGIIAACSGDWAQGIIEITASNFGGKLGKFQFHLHEILK